MTGTPAEFVVAISKKYDIALYGLYMQSRFSSDLAWVQQTLPVCRTHKLIRYPTKLLNDSNMPLLGSPYWTVNRLLPVSSPIQFPTVEALREGSNE